VSKTSHFDLVAPRIGGFYVNMAHKSESSSLLTSEVISPNNLDVYCREGELYKWLLNRSNGCYFMDFFKATLSNS